MKKMTLLSERLRYAVDLKSQREKGRRIFKTELAKNAGVSNPTVSYWMEDVNRISADNARKLGAWLGVDPLWLETGNGDPMLGPANTSAALPPRGRVPVISWVQAGMFTDTDYQLEVGDSIEWVTASVHTKENTFALRVQGDSMEPQFTEGMILIVEPSMSPEIGDFVVAKNGDHECTFKKLVKDSGEWFLKPLNSAYPTRPLGHATIVGVVREAIIKLR